MKVLLVAHTNNIRAGAGNMTHELCMFLKGKVDFTLLLPLDEKKYNYVSYPVEYILPPYIFSARTPKLFNYLFQNYTTDADIVHSVTDFPSAIVAATIARKNKIPLVIGALGTYAVKPLLTFPDNWLLKSAYNQASEIIAISQFTADAVKKYSETKTPIDIIHCAANFKRFSATYLITDIKEKYKDKKILITVGAVKPRKGHDIVLEALSLLKKDRNDFHYCIIGDIEKRDWYTTKLRSIIEKGNLQNNVTFTGSISDEDLPRYFSACDMYVHTPVMVNWNFEGFGIVYIEAGAAHKPVIASRSGGAPDAVISDVTGLLVPEGDILATSDAIRKLLDNESLRKKLGEGNFAYAQDHTWEKLGPKFIELYKRNATK